MSYIEEEELFNLESNLAKDWGVNSVLIYSSAILVYLFKKRSLRKAYYIPFFYQDRVVIIDSQVINKSIGK